MLTVFIIVMINFVVDVLYAVLDPRISLKDVTT
jgi:peptide/nickel transport system permease protein